METGELLIAGLGAILAFLFLGGALWYLIQRQNAVMKIRSQRVDAVNRLMEKFSSAKEVVELLESEQGRKLLEDPLPPTGNPRSRVLRFVRYGIVFLVLGPAFLIHAYQLRDATEINYIYQAKDLQFWGLAITALGIGLVLAAVATHILIKRWELNGSPKNGIR